MNNSDKIGSYKGTQFIKKCEMLLNIDDDINKNKK